MAIKNILSNLRTYLINEGFENVFIGQMPEKADDCILITQEGGEPDIYIPVRTHTIQILVRNQSSRSAYDTSYEIYEKLHRKYDDFVLVVGGVDVMLSDAITEPQQIGIDQTDRFIYSTNFNFMIRQDD